MRGGHGPIGEVCPSYRMIYYERYSFLLAWKTSNYLQQLLESGTVRPEPNDELAEFYSTSGSGSASASGTSETDSMRMEEKVGDASASESTGSSEKGVGQEQGPEGAHEQKQEHEQSGGKTGELLLHTSRAGDIVQGLGLQDRALGEIIKALEQVSLRLKKAKI